MNKILEAVDMLDNFGATLRFVAKNILHLKPGYFKFLLNFDFEVYNEGMTYREDGSTLHEIVLFKSAE